MRFRVLDFAMTSSNHSTNGNVRERRNFPRVHYRAQAAIEAMGGRWPVELVDLSFTGAMVVSSRPCPLDHNDDLVLHIDLPEQGDIKMCGHLAHVHGRYWGIECMPSGVDHRARLRKLLNENERSSAY